MSEARTILIFFLQTRACGSANRKRSNRRKIYKGVNVCDSMESDKMRDKDLLRFVKNEYEDVNFYLYDREEVIEEKIESFRL